MPRVSKVAAFITKIRRWEYWPFSVLYFPVYFYFGWLAMRARSIFFFTASNPSIEFGGMFGEKKSDIFDLIPDKYLPTTKLIEVGNLEKALNEGSKIGYPLIAKPNIGERGAWVKKVEDENELRKYVNSCPVDFLLQELVLYPIELGIFYVRYPGQAGKVTSVVRKEFLKVHGNGKSTIRELLHQNHRAVISADFESDFLEKEGSFVPPVGEEILVEPIGNHCRGTKFLNDEEIIDDSLHFAINKLVEEIPDFYFGRFDVRCASIEDLKKLQNFKILELNGAGSEPGHIYQPGFSLIKAYKVILWHLRVLADISILNHKRGIPYWSFKQGYLKWKTHNKHNRLLDRS